MTQTINRLTNIKKCLSFSNRTGPGLISALAILILAWVLPPAPGFATLVDYQIGFQSNAWNADDQHVVQNRVNIKEPAASTLPGTPQTSYIKGHLNLYQDQYYSAAGVSNPYIQSHVYAYTMDFADTYYTTQNTTGHTRTFNIPHDAINDKRVKRVRVNEYLSLNGSLMLTTAIPDTPNKLKGLLASFTLQVDVNKGGKDKKILKGYVQLIGKKNGKIKIVTKGAIKKKHFTIDPQADGLLKIDFNDSIIPFSTKVKVGQDFSFITTINSKAVNLGLGANKVIFGPGQPQIPIYIANGEIPEPAALTLLGLGALALLRRRKTKKI